MKETYKLWCQMVDFTEYDIREGRRKKERTRVFRETKADVEMKC